MQKLTHWLVILMITVGASACASMEPGTDPTDPPPPTGRTTTNLRVENYSSTSVWYLYVSPSTSGSWGSDQLGANIISPGETFTLRNIPCGRSYDVKAEGSGHVTLATNYGTYFSCDSDMRWTLTGG